MSADSGTDLEQRVENLEEQNQQLAAQLARYLPDGPSRRDVLKYGATAFAAAGVGSGLTGAALGDASTSDDDGNVGTPGDRVDVFGDGVESVDFQNEISSAAIQTAWDGLVVPIGYELGAADAIDPSTTSTPVQDAVDAIDATSQGAVDEGGTVLLPRRKVDESDTVSLVDKPAINIVGLGPNSSVIVFPDDVDGFQFGGTFRTHLANFTVESSVSGSSTYVFNMGDGGTRQGGIIKDISIDGVRVWKWYGGLFTVDNINPFECSFGNRFITVNDMDAGDEDHIIDWNGGGRSNYFGNLGIYPTDTVSGSDSAIYSDSGSNENSATFEWLNLGGTTGKIATVQGGFILGSVNYEPVGKNSDHTLFEFSGGQSTQRVFGVELTNGPSLNYVYRLDFSGNCIIVRPWDGKGSGFSTINDNIVELVDTPGSVHSYYFGASGDVDDNSGNANETFRTLATAGSGLG